MPTLLIRDIPEELNAWIAEQSYSLRTSKKEFVLSLLRKTWKGDNDMPLFDGVLSKMARSIEGIPFTFVDLFAGIGGMRIGLERVGGRCLFTSEWDKYAQKTYRAWFGEMPEGDIREISPDDIPDHDVLAAGFPCQPFSIAGVSKKNSLGRAHGFRDATQGTLFFQLATIIEIKRPPVILLEDVKNLRSHDGGNTWKVIRSTLEDLDYAIFGHVIDTAMANGRPSIKWQVASICLQQEDDHGLVTKRLRRFRCTNKYHSVRCTRETLT
jgi:C-5 cytosine-specific DNA methylase